MSGCYSNGCNGCSRNARFLGGVLKEFRQMPLEGKMILKAAKLNDQIKENAVMMKKNEEMLKMREATIDKMAKEHKESLAQQGRLAAKLEEKNEQLALDFIFEKGNADSYKAKLDEVTSRHAKEIEALKRHQDDPSGEQ